ncbi:MAG: AAA family ATPase [Muribaculaceae bacterium]|nr:AAA family ATPase [Muribaculaceae bacterium]
MYAFRICRIEAHNFKGFPELCINFSNNNYFILGGKNGYGKTTIFDAIELVITGKIQRLLEFNNFSDRRGKLSDNKKPLVHDTKVDRVSVEILVKKDGSSFWLKREARTEQLTNPLSFEPFNKLYLSECTPNKEKNYHEITDNELTKLFSKSLVSKYGFIYYLDQENSDQFLKSTSNLRRKKINSIFDIESFDQDLEKLDASKGVINELKNKYELKLNVLNSEKTRIMDSLRAKGKKEVPYLQLTNAQGWDGENPSLDIDTLTSLVGSSGLLTEARYYIQNREVYKLYCLKRDTQPFQNEHAFKDIAMFIQFSEEKEMLELYDLYSDLRILIDQDTDLDKLVYKLSEHRPILVKYIEEEELTSIIKTVKDIDHQVRQLNDLHKHYWNLWSQREEILKEYVSPAFQKESRCPLCGHDYGERTVLLDHINSQGELLKVMLDSMGNSNLSILSEFKIKFKVSVLDKIGLILSEVGIDNSVVEAVRNINYKQFLTTLIKTYGITIEKGDILPHTYNNVITVFNSIKENNLKDVDLNRLESFHISQLRAFQPSVFTIENIDLKQEYILSQWLHQSSDILIRLDKDIEMHEALLGDMESKLKTLSSIIKEIKTQKKSYIQKLISDIEILFYIYSGRIMQDCHYGRGVFLKYDEHSNVLFTAGRRDHDVDVLLNMSSGQITAVIISFMLALNKLYANHSFIAIDDPVQTMDDMNIWGLIETLRHEFRNYTVLISTHEESFGALLRYKASKMGIPSYYFDMRTIRN